jgi:hypothetical protein
MARCDRKSFVGNFRCDRKVEKGTKRCKVHNYPQHRNAPKWESARAAEIVKAVADVDRRSLLERERDASARTLASPPLTQITKAVTVDTPQSEPVELRKKGDERKGL